MRSSINERVVSPPRAELMQLRTPLEAGEMAVFEFFDRHLDYDWEIYLQPHLNGLRPDVVLLHPHAGIAVFEVKDWNLAACDWRIEGESSRPVLTGTDRGRSFRKPNPFDRLSQYRSEIADLYCPALNRQAGLAAVSAGLIFPFADEEELHERLGTGLAHVAPSAAARQYVTLAGRDSLANGDVLRILPEAGRRSSALMTPEIAADMRHWLVEPDVSAEQRQPLPLSASQQRYATGRTDSGYRRLRGPAGSGKTVVLAARAAQLQREGKSVLVVSFNITLLNYLRDCTVRFGTRINNVTWFNFHAWCERVASDAGRRAEYSALPWREQGNAVLDEMLPSLTASILGQSSEERYDAILVDEGQDFRPSWWDALRAALRPGGEMLLVADKAQDLYGRNDLWTDQAMLGAGFSGPWATLDVSYRLPPTLTGLTTSFVGRFLPNPEIDAPLVSAEQQLELEVCQLRWIHVRPEDTARAAFEAIRTSVGETTGSAPAAFADVVFLCDRKALGREVVAALRERGVKVIDTFSEDSREERVQKRYFFKGDARVKATTVMSFKGWEARHLVVATGSAADEQALSTVYTAMTRLKNHPNGSHLTVISSCPELRVFGAEWPVFIDQSTARRPS